MKQFSKAVIYGLIIMINISSLTSCTRVSADSNKEIVSQEEINSIQKQYGESVFSLESNKGTFLAATPISKEINSEDELKETLSDLEYSHLFFYPSHIPEDYIFSSGTILYEITKESLDGYNLLKEGITEEGNKFQIYEANGYENNASFYSAVFTNKNDANASLKLMCMLTTEYLIENENIIDNEIFESSSLSIDENILLTSYSSFDEKIEFVPYENLLERNPKTDYFSGTSFSVNSNALSEDDAIKLVESCKPF